MVRVLHALRDLKRRVAQAESRGQNQSGRVAVVGVIRDAGGDLGDLCEKLTGSSAPALCIQVRGAGNETAYAAHLAIDGIVRGEFSQAVLAVVNATTHGAILFKSMECAVRDRDAILALAEESAGESDIPGLELFDAIEASASRPAMVSGREFSIVFSIYQKLNKTRIAEIVSQALGLPSGARIESHVSCFAYGADSFAAVEIRRRLQQETGFDLPLTLVFEYPTVDALAAYLDEGQPRPPVVEVQPASGPGPFPASLGQAALWAIHRIDAASQAYNLRCAVVLDEHISLQRLREASRLTFERHPILRARFEEINGELMHVIEPVPCDPLELAEYSPQPFDLAKGTLARFCVSRNVLLFVCHHIVADFISINVILEDVRRFYRELASGALPPVAPEYTFFDYVMREHALPANVRADLARQWKQALGQNLPILTPFSGRSRTREMYRTGYEYQHAIDPELRDRIADAAKAVAGTVYQFMFAAYALALMEATGQTDLVVGTTVSLRETDAGQNAVGYFINPLPVRFHSPHGVTWEQYFEAHRRPMTGILRLRALPFAALVEHLSPRRDPLVSPVFQTMFTWLAGEPGDSAGPFREEVTPGGHQPAGVTHDLVLMVRQTGPDLRCSWCYQSPLFTSSEIENFSLRYIEVLKSVTVAAGEREEVVI